MAAEGRRRRRRRRSARWRRARWHARGGGGPGNTPASAARARWRRARATRTSWTRWRRARAAASRTTTTTARPGGLDGVERGQLGRRPLPRGAMVGRGRRRLGHRPRPRAPGADARRADGDGRRAPTAWRSRHLGERRSAYARRHAGARLDARGRHAAHLVAVARHDVRARPDEGQDGARGSISNIIVNSHAMQRQTVRQLNALTQNCCGRADCGGKRFTMSGGNWASCRGRCRSRCTSRSAGSSAPRRGAACSPASTRSACTASCRRSPRSRRNARRKAHSNCRTSASAPTSPLRGDPFAVARGGEVRADRVLRPHPAGRKQNPGDKKLGFGAAARPELSVGAGGHVTLRLNLEGACRGRRSRRATRSSSRSSARRAASGGG